MFSGKKKKEQLQAKREKKRQAAARINNDEHGIRPVHVDVSSTHLMNEANPVHLHDDDHEVAGTSGGVRAGEYKYGADRRGIRSVFKKETNEELEARKKLNYAPLSHRQMMTAEGIPVSDWLLVPADPARKRRATLSFPLSLPLPQRAWQECGHPEKEESENSASAIVPLSAEDINQKEEAQFETYIQRLDAYKVQDLLPDMEIPTINAYERNLDVWRQLWRTVEASDVVLLVADVRFPILHLPVSLLRYIILEEKKPCIIVLNKVDMVPSTTLQGWLRFLPAYLDSLGLVYSPSTEAGATDTSAAIPPILLKTFTANPVLSTNANADEPSLSGDANIMTRRRKEKKRAHLYEALRSGKLQAKKPAVPARGRRSGGNTSPSNSNSDQEEEDEEDEDEEIGYHKTTNFRGMEKANRALQAGKQDFKELKTVSAMISDLLQECRRLGTRSAPQSSRPSANAARQLDDNDPNSVRIGVVGHPNVGKSSLLNCIRGTKVVSVSSTAGRTKHLQTIPIPEEGVTLLDSPGIVFPVFGIPRQLQAIIGTHQVAQTRDPQSCVAYLAMHLPLEKLFGLRRPEGSCDGEEWCPYDFCEAYASKRGFYVKHGKGALDIHRASLTIIQEAYDGRIRLYFAPPDLSYLKSGVFNETIKPHLFLPMAP